MNKKFSTLVATLLVSGALFTLNAATVVTDLTADSYKDKIEVVEATQTTPKMIKFTADVTLDAETFIKITDSGVVIDGQGHTLKGSIVITGENCTVKNLKIEFENDFSATNDDQLYNNTTPACRGAIVVDANKATVMNNTIISSVPDDAAANSVADGIILLPKAEDASYTIAGNTIKAARVNDQGMGSIAIAVWENLKLNGDKVADGESVVELKEPVSLGVNTLTGSAVDYQYVKYEGWKNEGNNGMPVKEAIVTPNGGNGGALKDVVKRSSAESTVEYKGTVADLQKVLAETEGVNVAVVCTDGNVLYGNAENPNNGKPSIINGTAPAAQDVYGYKLIENPGSDYGMLILTAGRDQYIVFQGSAGAEIKKVVSESVLAGHVTNPASLWKMTSGKDHDGKVWYKFENQNGVLLKATGDNVDENAKAGTFFAEKNTPYSKYGVVLPNIVDGNKYSYGLYTTGYNTLSVEDLKWFEKDGFSVTIKHQNDKGEFKKEDIAGNPFVGHLKVVEYVGNNKFVEATSEFEDGKLVEADKDFYLMNAEGKLIVAQKYASSGSNAAQNTYTFTTVTAQALSHDIEKKEGKYFGVFQAEVSAKYKTDSYKDLKVIDKLSVEIGDKFAPIGRLDLGTNEEPTLAASFETDLKPIQVNLGGKDLVVAKNFLKKSFFTVTKLGENGGMLAVAGDKYEGGDYMYNFVSKVGNDLEKQFALTIEGGNYVFRNRENGYAYFRIPVGQLYYGKEDNEYLYGADTYRIEAVAEHKAIDGYEKLPDVKNNKFHISYASGIFGDAWFTENHGGEDNHTIGLSTDKDAALVFTATEFAREREIKHNETTHKDTYIPTDSIYVISTLGYYDGDTYKTDHKDTLKVVSYSFVNQYGEPLIWNENRYVSSTNKNVAADKFALRKDNGKLNLRPVVGEWDSQGKHYTSWISAGDNESYLTHQYFGTTNKAYAGDADEEGILSQTYMYNRTENDLFTVEPTEKPMYRTVINPLDTISIFRNDNPKSILFEDKGFLGMENLAQYPSIAPAMVADTAYVRDNTYRPQYMLVVNPDITPAGMWCEEHQSATCEHAVPTKGWVEGRYLVNLVDTAIVWDQANKHKDNNPYINTEKYYRLGFVQAKHIEDSLIIASTNDTLMVGTEDYNQAKFAFRYVDTDAKSFRIETANYETLPDATEAEISEDSELGYVKWMNGVVVVVDNIEDGDIFNMNEDEQGDPTANDEISASEVSVSATNGAIIVKGAEGKNVVITNVLGQQIANTVVTSSEATIAAPAGMVVVSVEGEAAVKAIVK